MELTDAARGRAILERWCVLAEQRLEYLTDLFETGRWRRYFGELAFLENVQEAKTAVATWHGLLNREASPDNRPIDLSWLGRRSALPPRYVAFFEDEACDQPSVPIAIDLPDSLSPPSAPMLSAAPQPESALPSISIATEDAEPWQQALDAELLQQRYPLLRNAF
ncbi:MAG: TIGR03809 family protein [Rhodopseudomonas sp.]|uniref:TIGR03809 family protein n=1 Tax=Rhodopseudomonas sp. TaxID=1078 RepID=UPI0017CA4A21|nr:TIGR03809 family protein [Rhodopseudomonas sp.]NVN87078.1 TIGR03809 family protein [Rhodopseudomonas sp.]